MLALLIGHTSCKKDDAINLNLAAPDSLRVPSDNAFVKLNPTTSASVVFEWKPGTAADGSLVMYELAFDKEAGDFSNPVYKIASDGNGGQNRATLSHKDLNKIANLAGIASLAKGKLKWTVLASKGTNVQKASADRLLEVERPAGFSEIPADVYITGDATEYGAELSKAGRLKQVRAGEFEIYTALKPGMYRFVNKTSGTPVSFSVTGNLIQENGETTVTGDSKVYRINLDFNNAAAKLTEIKEVGLWFSPKKQVIVALPYVGKGIWKVQNTPIEFFQESWGRDERYKFRLTVKEGGSADATEFMGSANADNQRPTASTPASFYYLVPVNNSDYDYTYKFRSELDKANADVTVFLSPDAEAYTHEITVR
jgi:hypothetical protein